MAPSEIDPAALHAEIQRHPGRIARKRWDELLDVRAVMEANQNELLAFIEAIERDENNSGTIMAGTIGSPKVRRQLFRELIRLLHNYVASAGTLIDHTRNLTRRYEGTPTHSAYNVRLKSAKDNGVVLFVSKLRNYVLHVGVPGLGVQFSVARYDGMETTTVVVYLDRDDALDWNEWPRLARVYLESRPQRVAIKAVLSEYAAVIDELYRWLYAQFEELHGADVDAANLLMSQLREYLGLSS